ncbi:hypothetical protein RJ641_023969 [Dillenia turbinata]|uniref:Uncharacterized protein n=1 Tax=Dillenia turbinata TaxID=194707 RepID=A0AAN8UIR4_9MAGN
MHAMPTLRLAVAVRVMAKDLIRTRHQIEKFNKLRSQLQGVSLHIQLMSAPSAAVAAPAAKSKVAQAKSTTNDDGGIDSELQARLDNLRRM